MPENSKKPKHNWSIEDNIIAYALYCITPDEKINISNNMVQIFAEKISTTVNSMCMKMHNFQYLYNEELRPEADKIYGLAGGAKDKKVQAVYKEYKNNWKKLSQDAEKITGLKIFNRPPKHGVFK